MSYIPASAYTVIEARQLNGVAIGRTISEKSPLYLFTGGSEPMVVHLTGPYAGHGYELEGFNSKPILAIEGVEFEIDNESLFQSAMVQEPVGALLLTENGIGIIVSRGDRNGFQDAISVYLDDDGTTGRRKSEFGFKKWKAFKQIGDQRIEIISFESTTFADR